MKDYYSIWITLPDAARSRLTKIVNDLSKKYGGPTFEPHMTIVVNTNDTLENVVSKTKSIAKNTKAFELELGNIDYSTTYFQCVFVRAKTSVPLINLATKAKEKFDISSFYMPHISLMYGNLDAEEKDKIARSIKLSTLKFKAEKLVITPAGESVPDPKDWKHLAEIPLGNKT